MKFSIITCTLNSMRYLSKSIESVLSQDYPDIEYIFVDGGSEDGTIDLIRAIPTPVIFISGVKAGIAQAMNEGILHTTGDVVAHLHSDDYYLHDKVLARVADVLDTSGAQWCFGRAMDDVLGQVMPEKWRVPAYTYQQLLKRNFIPHPSVFVRKQVFGEIGLFNSKYRYAMDYDMWLRIGKKYEPAQVNEHWSVFRRHDGSVSTANRLEGMKEDFGVRLNYVRKTPWDYTFHFARFVIRSLREYHQSVRGSR